MCRCAYCSRDASAKLWLLCRQHGQSSCGSSAQALVLFSGVEHDQLEPIVSRRQKHLLNLKHKCLSALFSSPHLLITTIDGWCLTSVLSTKLHMHSVADARTSSCSSNM